MVGEQKSFGPNWWMNSSLLKMLCIDWLCHQMLQLMVQVAISFIMLWIKAPVLMSEVSHSGVSRVINAIRSGAYPCASGREKLFNPEPCKHSSISVPFLAFLEMEVMFPLFQLVGIFLDWLDFTDMMGSGFATSFTSSLGIHELVNLQVH